MKAVRQQMHRPVSSIDCLISSVNVFHMLSLSPVLPVGGGRIDFEVLKRTHRFWASDNNDALGALHHTTWHELLFSLLR